MGRYLSFLFSKRRELLNLFSLIVRMHSAARNILNHARLIGLSLLKQLMKVVVKHILKLGYLCLSVIEQIDTQLYPM